MSDFKIDLLELESGPIEKVIHPGEELLAELFDGLEDFEIGDPSEFEADLRVYKERSTVYVDGRVTAEFDYRCGRCLQDRELEIDKDVDFVLMSEEEWASTYEDSDEIALEAEDMDVSFYTGEVIDLGPLYREAVLLEFPAYPHCPESLREECDAAYEENVGDETLEKQEEHEVDLRWWPLKDIDLDEDDADEAEAEDEDIEERETESSSGQT